MAVAALTAASPRANTRWALSFGTLAVLLGLVATTSTAAAELCGSAARAFDRRDAPSWTCTFSTAGITDPHGQAEQRVYATGGGGLFGTEKECAARAKAVHPAATGAAFAVVGGYAGWCYAKFGTVRVTQHTNYDSCLYAEPTNPARASLIGGVGVNGVDAPV